MRLEETGSARVVLLTATVSDPIQLVWMVKEILSYGQAKTHLIHPSRPAGWGLSDLALRHFSSSPSCSPSAQAACRFNSDIFARRLAAGLAASGSAAIVLTLDLRTDS